MDTGAQVSCTGEDTWTEIRCPKFDQTLNRKAKTIQTIENFGTKKVNVSFLRKSLSLISIFNEYIDVFTPIKPGIKNHLENIILKNYAKDVLQKSRPIPFKLKPRVENLLKSLIEEDFRESRFYERGKFMGCLIHLPLGVSSAPAIFQATTAKILIRIPNTAFYFDNIIVTGRNDELHENILGKLHNNSDRVT
ncbi:hypothetical protein RF11_07525 [Thelohanellus kitauei]|uniref:Reverse transcriptase domain-containing protein n=1 Tax=Thelohanellus kitauei TaxID=669202 RepID=A0A0C2I8U2_THEKT|nr:hypothetical protein RF11_07525 [Thelohanellus kitauei]